ncbi:MAG: FeoB small GTPase domain-containing protein, partial [Chitinophagaceae bacterium]
MQTQHLHIALMGNPNSGKSSLFNELTGLRQKVGNFPGVTVDKKTGRCPLQDGLSATLIDLPGSYSLYPRREDEWVSYRILMDQEPAIRPDLILLVVDASNLKRNLLFVSQVIDLKIPVLIALTMQDIARQKNIVIDVPGLARELGVPIISINPRKGKGMEELKRAIAGFAYERHKIAARDFFKLEAPTLEAVKKVQQLLPDLSAYKALHYLINHSSFTLDKPNRDQFLLIEREASFNATKAQAEEILQRYQRINSLLKQTVAEPSPMHTKFLSDRIDDVLLHRTWGYLILLAVLFLLFQSVFWLAEFPMNGIEWLFAKAGALSATHLPPSWFSDLLINGLLAGLSGIVVFVPQIMILFGLITILEDTGYMARISFLSDKLMRKTGLNGKSVMPM